MVTRVPPPSAQPRSRMRILLASGAAALALAAGSIVPGMPLGAAPQQAQAADSGKTTLTVAVAQSVDSLSPFLAQRLISTSVHRLMYDFLTNYDPKDNHTVPGLATKWEPSADKLTWTYTIRANSKWSDGQQATAEDAAWTFNKMMTDEGAATANGSFVANFKKVTAPSPDEAGHRAEAASGHHGGTRRADRARSTSGRRSGTSRSSTTTRSSRSSATGRSS